tara:strand:- start:9 stop:368 length:360 start_codon:yes stop_codon:yes gene_type:complete
MWISLLESTPIDEYWPTSAEESIVKFSQLLSSKYDVSPVVVNVRFVPPVCVPVVGDIVQTDDSPLPECSILSSRLEVCDIIGENITLSIDTSNRQETNKGALSDFCIKSSRSIHELTIW